MLFPTLSFLLFHFCICIQYIDFLHSVDPIDVSRELFNYSFVTRTDDTPFDMIQLPFVFLFYDKRIKIVWISPNGYISMKPGAPCGCCYASTDCSLETSHYEALIAPYLADLSPSKGRNTTSIRYRIEPHRLIVIWDDVPDYDGEYYNSFMAVLNENGSIFFCYKDFQFPFRRTGYIINGLIGIRPFSRFIDYSTRGRYRTTNADEWGTSRYGNYPLYRIISSIANLQVQPRSYLFHSVVMFLLSPTELCISPSIVVQSIPVNLTVSYSWLDPSYPASFIRCSFNRMVHSSVIIISGQSLICIEPNFNRYSIHKMMEMQLIIEVYSLVDELWIPIELLSDAMITVTGEVPKRQQSPSQQSPSHCNLNGSCDRCGYCITNSTSILPNQCIGIDNIVYGHTQTDCSVNEIFDSFGSCCLPSMIDCTGVCNGQYVVALNLDESSLTCCLSESIDCMQICDGNAFLDDCGICSGGTSNHRKNSDVDCDGICFGHNTMNCIASIHSSHLIIQYSLGVTFVDSIQSQIFFLENIGDYPSILHTQTPRMINFGFDPFLFLSFYISNNSQIIPIDLVSFIFLPNTKIYVNATASNEAFIKNTLINFGHRKHQDITFLFTPLTHNISQGSSLTISLFFDTHNCELIRMVSTCSLLPHCYSCFYKIDRLSKMSWFSHSLQSIQEEFVLFHLFDETKQLYQTCRHGDEQLICLSLLNETKLLEKRLKWQFSTDNFLTISSFLLYGILIAMFIIVCFDVIVITRSLSFLVESHAITQN